MKAITVKHNYINDNNNNDNTVIRVIRIVVTISIDLAL